MIVDRVPQAAQNVQLAGGDAGIYPRRGRERRSRKRRWRGEVDDFRGHLRRDGNPWHVETVADARLRHRRALDSQQGESDYRHNETLHDLPSVSLSLRSSVLSLCLLWIV